MIGPDDWCINFNKESKICNIYSDRPNFCRVDKSKFMKMYDIEDYEFGDFCSFCCREHITDVYGEESKEMQRYEDVIKYLEDLAESEQFKKFTSRSSN